MYPLYIITESSRGNNYGVGTYIDQLVQALKSTSFQVHVIHLRDNTHTHLSIEEKDGVTCIFLPIPEYTTIKRDYKKDQQRYYRNVFYLLKPYLGCHVEGEILFHFNFFMDPFFAKLLKEHFICRILLTVHYMAWSIALLGDTYKLEKALNAPKTLEEERIKESVVMEKEFIDTCCDRVIAIAQHSYDTLRNIYSIPGDRISLIPNGLRDSYKDLSHQERAVLRQQYHFAETEKLIIFAGRLDPCKGVYWLIDSFEILIKQDSSVRLIIVGDGNLEQCIQKTSLFWGRVTFTGFIDKEYLYNLYRIADVGVLPSMHEEFGYVALEMMMIGLPLVVTRTTGLRELLNTEEIGVTIPIAHIEDDNPNVVEAIRQNVASLLYDQERLKRYKKNARQRFVDNYELSLFKQQIERFYHQCREMG